MKIAFDLDDVLSAFNRIFIPYHNKKYGTDLTYEEKTNFKYAPILKLTDQEVHKRIFEFYVSHDCDTLPIEEFALDYVKQLSQAGHELYVITARDPMMKDRTENWIDTNFKGLFKEVVMTKQFLKDRELNNASLKSDACIDRGITVIFDDATHNALDCAEAGIKVYLINKPWNILDKIENTNIIRIDNLKNAPIYFTQD